MPWRSLTRLFVIEPLAESPSTINNSVCSLPVGLMYLAGNPLIAEAFLTSILTRPFSALSRISAISLKYLQSFCKSLGFFLDHSVKYWMVNSFTNGTKSVLEIFSFAWPVNSGSKCATDTMALRPERISLFVIDSLDLLER